MEKKCKIEERQGIGIHFLPTPTLNHALAIRWPTADKIKLVHYYASQDDFITTRTILPRRL